MLQLPKKVVNDRPLVLTAEQRGWIKGRNECWKSDNKRRCVEESNHFNSIAPGRFICVSVMRLEHRLICRSLF